MRRLLLPLTRAMEVYERLWTYVGSYEVDSHKYCYVLDEVGSRLCPPSPSATLREAISPGEDTTSSSPGFAMALILTPMKGTDAPIVGYSAIWPRRDVEAGEQVECFGLPHTRGLSFCLEEAVCEDDEWIHAAPPVVYMEDQDTGESSSQEPKEEGALLLSIKGLHALLQVRPTASYYSPLLA